MLDYLSNFIIKFRLYFVISILIITAFMGYKTQFIEYNYSFAKTVPDTDEDMIFYQNFREIFGEDGNIVNFVFNPVWMPIPSTNIFLDIVFWDKIDID